MRTAQLGCADCLALLLGAQLEAAPDAAVPAAGGAPRELPPRAVYPGVVIEEALGPEEPASAPERGPDEAPALLLDEVLDAVTARRRVPPSVPFFS